MLGHTTHTHTHLGVHALMFSEIFARRSHLVLILVICFCFAAKEEAKLAAAKSKGKS